MTRTLVKTTVTTTTVSGLTMHRLPRRACTWTRDRKIVATARFAAPRVWLLTITGHQWFVTPDMPTARFHRIPGHGMTHTSVKAFPSWQQCAIEVENVMQSMKEKQDDSAPAEGP